MAVREWIAAVGAKIAYEQEHAIGTGYSERFQLEAP